MYEHSKIGQRQECYMQHEIVRIAHITCRTRYTTKNIKYYESKVVNRYKLQSIVLVLFESLYAASICNLKNMEM